MGAMVQTVVTLRPSSTQKVVVCLTGTWHSLTMESLLGVYLNH